MIRHIINQFVREKYPDNRFVKDLVESSLLFNPKGSDTEIIEDVYNALVYGASACIEESLQRAMFSAYQVDIVKYFEGYLNRAGYDDFYAAKPDTPLYKFIMPLVLNDFVYCLAWYIVERFEDDYTELQDKDTLEDGLIWLKNKLAELETEKRRQEDFQDYLEEVSGFDRDF